MSLRAVLSARPHIIQMPPCNGGQLVMLRLRFLQMVVVLPTGGDRASFHHSAVERIEAAWTEQRCSMDAPLAKA
jgi:hypothetical protein